MEITTLEAEAQRLVLAAFTEETALSLGLTLVELARAAALPVVINIRTADRTLFHAALPGAAPNNDNWARRKSNVALLFHLPSLLVGAQMQASGRSLADHGLSPQDYADHGGAVPIRVRGVGVVAVATVSGLPSVEDHRLVVRALETLL
ncbi:MAG: hypothetical protein A2092_02980 [Rhodobacteraceae bacterium GWE1_64_9]|nr:MAG: hypothetical protein A2092_02980 [Rhodobacteraceae bacterium GWE1_64_9]OHC50698.1 MAG: hypothetical protein A2X69_15070 [Rhodobacteraceae bacterium GWF1_65_7]HBD91401.1 heme-degrading domain-containing protein [Gemmobacter sp.]